MRRFLLALVAAALLVGCATAKDEEVETKEESVEDSPYISQINEQQPWGVPSASEMTQEQWDAMFPPKEDVPEIVEDAAPTDELSSIEEPDASDEPVVESIEANPEDIESEESSVYETETETEGEPDVSFVLPEVEESYVPPAEESVEMPEMEYSLAGEDYRSLSWIFDEDETPDAKAIDRIEEVPAVRTDVWVEDVNPDLIGEMAEEYAQLEKVDMAKPDVWSTVLSFVKGNLLWFEVGGIALLFVVSASVVASNAAKRRSKEKESPVEDEGQEIDMTPGSYYASPTVYPNDDSLEDPKPESEGPEDYEEPAGTDSDDDPYNDGFM